MRYGSRAARLASATLSVALAAGCGAADGANGGGERPQDAAAEAATRLTLEGEAVPIRVAGIEIEVEIADEESERSKGLMFRESLPENRGMLFVYPEERPLGFWMRNTLIPLDIAFIDREGRIVDIQQMQPRDETTHYSKAPAMYALEMNEGWFAAHDIEVGDRVEF